MRDRHMPQVTAKRPRRLRQADYRLTALRNAYPKPQTAPAATKSPSPGRNEREKGSCSPPSQDQRGKPLRAEESLRVNRYEDSPKAL